MAKGKIPNPVAGEFQIVFDTLRQGRFRNGKPVIRNDDVAIPAIEFPGVFPDNSFAACFYFI